MKTLLLIAILLVATANAIVWQNLPADIVSGDNAYATFDNVVWVDVQNVPDSRALYYIVASPGCAIRNPHEDPYSLSPPKNPSSGFRTSDVYTYHFFIWVICDASAIGNANKLDLYYSTNVLVESSPTFTVSSHITWGNLEKSADADTEWTLNLNGVSQAAGSWVLTEVLGFTSVKFWDGSAWVSSLTITSVNNAIRVQPGNGAARFSLTRSANKILYAPDQAYFAAILYTTIPDQVVGVCSSGLSWSAWNTYMDAIFTSDNNGNCAAYTDNACSKAFTPPDARASGEGVDMYIKCSHPATAQTINLRQTKSNVFSVLADPNAAVCYVSCATCTATGTSDNMQCDSCAASFYPLVDDSTMCYQPTGGPDNVPDHYVIDPAAKVFKQCYSSCQACTAVGDAQNMHCSTCASDYAPLQDDTSRCYESTDTVEGYTYEPNLAVFVPNPPPAQPFEIEGPLGPFIELQCYPVHYSNLKSGSTYHVGEQTPTTNAQCYYYSADGCNTATATAFVAQSTSATMYVKCTMTYWAQLTLSDGTNTVSSNHFPVKGVTAGGLCGDPHFYGFDGRTFTFNGAVDHIYNVFSNEHVNLNSLFSSAHASGAKRQNNTINGAFGIRTHELNLTMYATHYSLEKSHIIFTLNGERRTIQEGQTIHHKCATMSLERNGHVRHHHHTFTLVTSKFEIYVYISSDRNNKFINTRFFDYFVSANMNEKLGGILGATSKAYDIEDLVSHEDKFRVSDLLSADEGSSAFLDLPVCSAFSVEKSKRKNVVCAELPDGHACTKNIQCANARCTGENICAPATACFSDAACNNGKVCRLGSCATA